MLLTCISVGKGWSFWFFIIGENVIIKILYTQNTLNETLLIKIMKYGSFLLLEHNFMHFKADKLYGLIFRTNKSITIDGFRPVECVLASEVTGNFFPG